VVEEWGELYRTVLPDLVRFLHRKVWDMERAKDLAQDTFVRALREKPDRPRAWLFTVAANLAKDEARTMIRRKGHLTLLKAEAERSAVTRDASEDLERSEQEASVRRALDALGERDREALLLWDAGLDYGEIADALEISTGSVGTTLARARERLVKAHRKQEQDDVAHQ
jgi:RNA polymerase sigma-70 factor (ECF subfamily)